MKSDPSPRWLQVQLYWSYVLIGVLSICFVVMAWSNYVINQAHLRLADEQIKFNNKVVQLLK